MPYVYIQISPDRIEDGTFSVDGDRVRVDHSGGGVSRGKLAPGEDRQTIAARARQRARLVLRSDQLQALELGVTDEIHLRKADHRPPTSRTRTCPIPYTTSMIYGSASIGRNALGFALGDIALMFRHSRHATILGFAQLGGRPERFRTPAYERR